MGNVLSRALIEIVMKSFTECIIADRYIVYQRDKNKAFIRGYGLTTQEQKEMLLMLTLEDYLNSEESQNFRGKFVHTMSRTFELGEPEKETVDLYVKFEIEQEENEEAVAVISFHALEYPVRHPFGPGKEDKKI